MKKIAGVMALFIIFATGCGARNTSDSADTEEQSVFSGEVIRITGDGSLIIKPDEGEEIRQSGTEVSVSPENDEDFNLGDHVLVTHEGPVMESHPLQVHLIAIERVDD